MYKTLSDLRRGEYRPLRHTLLTSRLFLYFVAIGLSGCHMVEKVFPVEQSYIDDPVSAYKIQRNIRYGKDPLHFFDLYLPVSDFSNPAELVVLIHGGAWYAGDKSWLSPTVDSLILAKKNLAVVNMNYRLVPGKESLVNSQLADIDSCLNFVLKRAETYNIRKKIVLAGISAGGHLALTYAYTRKNVAAVVGVSAYTELSDRLFMDKNLRENVEYLIGQKYGDSLSIFQKASPLYLADHESPPTVLLYGMADQPTTHQQGRLLVAKLQSMNVPNSYAIYPGEDHNISAGPVYKSIFSVLGARGVGSSKP